MLIDAHCHLASNQELAQLQIKQQIKAIINCQTPEEWQINSKLTMHMQPLSFGIHPWDVNKLKFEEIVPYLKLADAVGEIGLDSVWTKNDMALQTKTFRKQLAWAAKKQKPVILHTKGCEKEILAIIRQYPNNYFVHWYDCRKYQKDYIDLDCYFSICLDIIDNPAVIKLAQSVPLDHLLIETDGLNSVEWLLNKPVSVTDYSGILKQTLTALAHLRHIDSNKLATILGKNLIHFLGQAK
ncbi:TatD family hydrolase [Lactobacillus apis]|uniref:Hydrolase, TatD family n=1 Tax=Lactobacillus apis TaxID=303541 RepID=A0A0F4LS34_9LACO|nr:TatD family hydrolase [Lactobacillus apis]KJY61375.1 Hydrolase, TatD family [Lactobacillus apis]